MDSTGNMASLATALASWTPAVGGIHEPRFHRVSLVTRRAASRCMDRSTQLSWTRWKHPMGWPKTMRVRVYSNVKSRIS